MPVKDIRDDALITERLARWNEDRRPRVGDYAIVNGEERRISHVWGLGDDPLDVIQTSYGGSWYLGDGYVSFSGSLEQGIHASRFRLTDECRGGSFWIFHHNHWKAHNGVDFTIPCRVWIVDEGQWRGPNVW